MEDLVFIGQTGDATNLYVSELSAETLFDNGFADQGGLFLYEEFSQCSGEGIRVLAKVADLAAAYRLWDLMASEVLAA